MPFTCQCDPFSSMPAGNMKTKKCSKHISKDHLAMLLAASFKKV